LKRLAVSVLALPPSPPRPGRRLRQGNYKSFWDNNSPLAKSLTPEQYAQLSRTALRGFDALLGRDERFANDFFNKLGSGSCQARRRFQSDQFLPLAKKK